MGSIEIKQVTKLDDARQLEDVQRATWHMTDLEMVPSRFMYVMRHSGACLLGAFDGDRLVGFVFGLLGTVEGLEERVDQVAAARLQLYSVIMGVLPEYQMQGIGYRLKLAQREFAVRIGIRMISWTFDALESRNAYFNLKKLGVVCHRYIRDYHGDLGGLNAGLTTDRLFVEWWVTSNRVENRLSSSGGPLSFDAYLQGGALLINEAYSDERGLPAPPPTPELVEGRNILLEIPPDIQLIKKMDMALARTWRDYTRRLFEHYFQNGYMITDFVFNQEDDGRRRSMYVLTRVDS